MFNSDDITQKQEEIQYKLLNPGILVFIEILKNKIKSFNHKIVIKTSHVNLK